MHGTSRPVLICSGVKPSCLADPLREFGVGLVEDGVVVVCGGGVGSFQNGLGGGGDVLEVGGLAGEAVAVLGVFLVQARRKKSGVSVTKE